MEWTFSVTHPDGGVTDYSFETEGDAIIARQLAFDVKAPGVKIGPTTAVDIEQEACIRVAQAASRTEPLLTAVVYRRLDGGYGWTMTRMPPVGANVTHWFRNGEPVKKIGPDD